jgi:hypothetical protein
MVGSRDRMQQGLSWLLLPSFFACSHVDIAGTLVAESQDGGAQASAADAGAAAVATTEESDSESASEGVPCDGVSHWLTYSQVDLVSLTTLGLSDGLREEVELLFVDEHCTYWVRHAGTAEDVRTGVLDAEQAQELWDDLGANVWAGLQGQHGTASSGTVRVVQDRTEELVCLGECESPDVDARVQAVFALATAWVERLYPQGARFDGGVIAFGVPVGELPLVTIGWPLDTPMAEFFGSAFSAQEETGVRLEGEEADRLREMKRQAVDLNATLGPVVIAEDLAGDTYAILIQEAGPTLP